MGSGRAKSSKTRQWICFTFVVAAIAGVSVLYATNMARWRNSPDYGWRTMYDSGPNIVAEVFKRGEEAGLRVNDRIVAINGTSYNTFDELFFKVRKTAPGSVNTYTIERHGEEIEVTVTSGQLGLRTVMRRSGILYLCGLAYVFIGALVFLMKPGTKESWLFFIMTCLLGARISWAGPSDLFYPLWLFDLRNLLNLFLPATMIHLPLIFPKTHGFISKRQWLFVIPYLLSGALFVLMITSADAYWNIPPFLTSIYNIYVMIAIVVFMASMIRNLLRDRSVLVKLQSQVILLGIVLGFFIPAGDLILRSFWRFYLFPDPAIGFAVFLTAFPLSIGYTIIKYDLFAIDTIIKRTYGYLLTTGTIAGVYALFVSISNLAFGKFEFTKSQSFPMIFILGVVFFLNPVRNRVQRIIDRVFYRLEYDYQDTVHKISETMRSLLNLDEIGRSLMRFSLQPMFVDAGSVLLLNPNKAAYECLIQGGQREKWKVGAADGALVSAAEVEKKGSGEPAGAGVNGPGIWEWTIPADAPLVQKMAVRKKEVTIYDIEKDPFFEEEREACERAFEQLGATLLVPLIYEDKLTGLISLGRKKSGKFYRREDINLLTILANQGAVAIENARMVGEVIEKERMEEELSIARDLQKSMLPAACPKVEGFEIAALSTQAREVGGDFFDFIQMGEDRVGLLVGDVTGKSVSGALVMSASRSVFRMLSEENLGVAGIMTRANRRTKKDIKSGMFVALLYAVLDSQEKALSLCSAGQTQPVYFSSQTGEAKLLETEGDTFPLGIIEEAEYQETRLQLNAGDKVVFYTDGIVEAMNEKQEIYGFERLLDLMKSSGSLDAESLLNEIMRQVHEFVGRAPQSDDLTVIVVSVNDR